MFCPESELTRFIFIYLFFNKPPESGKKETLAPEGIKNVNMWE